MFGNKTLDRLDKMLEEAMSGEFKESSYDETKLSRLESKWKQFLGNSFVLKENLEKERDSVKSLVSDISHQSKTPMTNIKMYSQLLEENLESGNTKQNQLLIQEIIRQTDRLEFLIQALTKLSRLESNVVEVKPVKQSVRILIEAVVNSMSEKARRKQIEIQVLSDINGETCFDLKWTKEALENLLDNAVKYSSEGSQITITVTEYEMYTAIGVKDQGIGIPEEEIPKIFGRFYRSEQVQQEEGVGIGLYLAREIVSKQDGYLKVKSKSGEGSEFQMFLRKN
ncbi:MAG: HAMP domain-containing histidine kinase [Lachnospiraceae bacterium]|nr:HAMP domain-containing histidine kinase [Lachnospiraceae bacterium]